MFIEGFIIYLASLLFIQQVACGALSATSKSIIDRETLGNDALIKICSDPSQRISKVSTISWLLAQLKSSTDQSLDTCKEQYLEPLEALNQVTSTKAEDVCSLDKVKLIDQFQWNYEMGAMSKKWAKFAKGPLPDPLKVFFLNYVSDITSRCKASLPENLEMAVVQMDSLDEALQSPDGDFEGMIDKWQQVLVQSHKVKSYDNFFLFWDVMVNHARKSSHHFEPLKEKDGSLLSVKVKDATKVWNAQQICRKIMRPVYKNTVLPVMKLIDMGYDSKEKGLNAELKANGAEQKDWYMITQTCELLLPITFYESPLLKSRDIRLLKSNENPGECVRYPPADRELTKITQVQVRAIGLRDELQLAPDEGKLLKTVKANAKSRSHLYRTVVRNVMVNSFSKNFNGYSQIISMVKKLRPSGPRGHYPQADDEQVASEAVKETDNLFKEDENLDAEPIAETNELKRQKRATGDMADIGTYGLVIGVLLQMLVY